MYYAKLASVLQGGSVPGVPGGQDEDAIKLLAFGLHKNFYPLDLIRHCPTPALSLGYT